MQNKLLVLLLFVPAIFASNPSSFFAEKISFDGKNLTLSQGVHFEHPLGDFSAREITLLEPSIDPTSPFSHALLQGDVTLHLEDGKKAKCQTAEIDQKKQLIQLLGDQDLFFSMPYKDGQLELTCEEINAKYTLDRDHFLLSQIDASSRIHFSWQNSSFFSDTLHVEDLQGDYLIQAFSQNQGSRCKLLHEASIIHAAQIQYETQNKQFFLERPQGIIPVGFISGASADASQFSSDILLWDLEAKRLSLVGEVRILEKDVALFETSESMNIYYSKDIADTWSVDKVTSLGFTHITAIDPNRLQHEILCHKRILFEKKEQRILLESPLTPAGDIIEGRQIRYEGLNTAVYGTKGLIMLKEKQKKMGIHQIILSGSIRLFSHDPKNLGIGAIADEMIVQTDKELITLLARNGNKVLYVDEKEGVFVSAKKIVIYNPTSKGKKTVRAFGSVKFCFNAQENALLRKIFPYLHLPKES